MKTWSVLVLDSIELVTAQRCYVSAGVLIFAKADPPKYDEVAIRIFAPSNWSHVSLDKEGVDEKPAT